MDRTVLTRALSGGAKFPRTLFSWIGWALLALAFFLALRADEARREWIQVEGKIVDFTIGETDAPVVDYIHPDGTSRRVTGEVSSNPRAGKIGDRVPVLINPQDTEVVRLGTPLELWFFPGLLGFIGGVFAVIGVFGAAAGAVGRLPGQMSDRRLQALRETGERVMARVSAILAQGANPATRAPAHWRLQAVWRDDSGAPRTFISQPIAIDPAPHVNIGDEIGVYIDRDNPKVYAFDFSMLPFGP